MEKSSFNQFAGTAGILSALLFIISIVGMQYYLASSLEDVNAFTQNMMDAHSMMLLYGWPGFIATLLILPLTYAVYRFNDTTRLVSRMVFLITVIGLCFILVGYLFHLALTYFYAPLHQSMNGDQQSIFGMVIKTTIGLQDMFWLSGDLLSFLGIGILLVLGWEEDVFPKWFLVMGIVAGVLAAVGSFSFIPAFKKVPGLSFLFIGGFSIFAIWEVLAGFKLIKLSRSRP